MLLCRHPSTSLSWAAFFQNPQSIKNGDNNQHPDREWPYIILSKEIKSKSFVVRCTTSLIPFNSELLLQIGGEQQDTENFTYSDPVQSAVPASNSVCMYLASNWFWATHSRKVIRQVLVDGYLLKMHHRKVIKIWLATIFIGTKKMVFKQLRIDMLHQ